ncbi:MAG: hypothetical protein ACTSRZ_08330 [Promethearchaeota archaeon]
MYKLGQQQLKLKYINHITNKIEKKITFLFKDMNSNKFLLLSIPLSRKTIELILDIDLNASNFIVIESGSENENNKTYLRIESNLNKTPIYKYYNIINLKFNPRFSDIIKEFLDFNDLMLLFYKKFQDNPIPVNFIRILIKWLKANEIIFGICTKDNKWHLMWDPHFIYMFKNKYLYILFLGQVICNNISYIRNDNKLSVNYPIKLKYERAVFNDSDCIGLKIYRIIIMSLFQLQQMQFIPYRIHQKDINQEAFQELKEESENSLNYDENPDLEQDVEFYSKYINYTKANLKIKLKEVLKIEPFSINLNHINNNVCRQCDFIEECKNEIIKSNKNFNDKLELTIKKFLSNICFNKNGLDFIEEKLSFYYNLLDEYNIDYKTFYKLLNNSYFKFMEFLGK